VTVWTGRAHRSYNCGITRVVVFVIHCTHYLPIAAEFSRHQPVLLTKPPSPGSHTWPCTRAAAHSANTD
jgi:hypothetical protein